MLFVSAPMTAVAAPPPPPGDEHGPVKPYVVGGRDATQVYSFMASLQLPDGRHFCGGSLIAKRWVVSAAHCMVRVVPGETRVRVGSLDRTAGGSFVGVTRVISHPQYDPNKPGYDIALIELDQAVPQRPIPIAPRAGGSGTDTRIMGWGVTCDRDLVNDPTCRQSPKVLQELDTVVADDERCSFFDPKHELCTASRDGEARMGCFGDSGGPQVRKMFGRWWLVGATTGDGDDSEMRPYVCTTGPDGKPGVGIWQDVPTYRGWITDTIWTCDAVAGAELRAQVREAESHGVGVS
ncbi:S1 family peptidase [Lentzea tibetensis]|uniref:S1 family peptidase n=1 Tax=Lentzea tibetensis TaxID=2591470 RepID=UPI0016482E40|nr:serine protease [Lentzea tibetensis]